MDVTRALKIFFFLIFSIGCSSCGRKSIHFLEKRGVRFLKQEGQFSTGVLSSRIQIQYLGCGGVVIHESGRNILIDPFFSNQRFMKIGAALTVGTRIKSRPGSIDYGKRRILDSLKISRESFLNDTRAIFAAHGHYDHLMDVPFIHRNWFGAQPEVYVNTSSFYSVKNLINASQLHDVDSIVSNHNRLGDCINIAGSDGTIMKIYPIVAAHNPHAKNIKLFSGSVQQPSAKYNSPTDKTSVSNWLEGKTLSFLIDIEKGEEILFRMFIQSSSCDYPDGMPPQVLLVKKTIDVALLGVASFKFSEKTYPSKFLEMLNPKTTVFIHWEDFFRRYKKKPKSVIKNDLVRYFNEVVPAAYRKNYVLPLPGTVLTFD